MELLGIVLLWLALMVATFSHWPEAGAHVESTERRAAVAPVSPVTGATVRNAELTDKPVTTTSNTAPAAAPVLECPVQATPAPATVVCGVPGMNVTRDAQGTVLCNGEASRCPFYSQYVGV